MENQEGKQVSRDIAVYQNGKQLLAFQDGLAMADITDYAKLHADWSRIWLTLTDYSPDAKAKNGGKSVTATFKLEPEKFRRLKAEILASISEKSLDARLSATSRKVDYLCKYAGEMGSRLIGLCNGISENLEKASEVIMPESPKAASAVALAVCKDALVPYTHTSLPEYEFSAEKINARKQQKIGGKDYSSVSKISIKSVSIATDGTPRRQPWLIRVEEGWGIAEKTSTGGTKCAKNSYKTQSAVNISLSDGDFAEKLIQTEAVLNAFEVYAAARLFNQKQ